MLKTIEPYTLNICHFLYISYNSISLLKKEKNAFSTVTQGYTYITEAKGS